MGRGDRIWCRTGGRWRGGQTSSRFAPASRKSHCNEKRGPESSPKAREKSTGVPLRCTQRVAAQWAMHPMWWARNVELGSQHRTYNVSYCSPERMGRPEGGESSAAAAVMRLFFLAFVRAEDKIHSGYSPGSIRG